jgi:glycosyltransferase involved in cell wall biosynthesis
MRILMLATSLPKWPGETTAPFIEEIAAGLAARGHQVTMVAPWQSDIRRAARERGVDYRFFRYAPHPALQIWGYAQALERDTRLRWRALAAAPFATAAATAALQHEVTMLQRSGRSYDLVHAHWALPNGLPAAVVAWRNRLPLAVSLHGSDVYMGENSGLWRAVARGVLRRAAVVTACSADLSARGIALGARPARTRVIPYGVDPDHFTPQPAAAAAVRAEFGLTEATPLVLGLGRLVAKKGFNVLLDAWPLVLQQLPAARLLIVGDGDLAAPLHDQAQRLGIVSSVIFAGRRDRTQTAAAVAAADVFALPIVTDGVDGLPNALLEAMAAGRPLVASRVAGVPDVITDGEHGLLVPQRDPAALAAALLRLLQDRTAAARLAANARARVLAELTWPMTAARYEDALAGALRGDGQ